MIFIFSSLLSVLLLSAPVSVNLVCGQVQVTVAIRTLQGGSDGQCPSMKERERAKNEIRQVIDSVIATKLPSTTVSTATMPTTAATTTVSPMTDCS